MNRCTTEGQLHTSLSEPVGDSTSSKPSLEFVKASELLGKKSTFSANDSAKRSNSLHPSFVSASKLITAPLPPHCDGVPEVSSSSSETPSSSSTATDVKLVDPRREMAESTKVGFCTASDLMPSYHSRTATATREMKSQSSSKADSVASCQDGVKSTYKKEQAVAKKPAVGKKRKVDPAVAKTKKITCFFEKYVF